MVKTPVEHRPRNIERGIALIAVLWLLATLTAIAVLVAALSLDHLRAVRAMGEAVQADSVADSAIRLTLFRLAGAQQRGSDAMPESRQTDLLGWTVNVRTDLESGRLDLNTGDRQLLFALFAANGWSESDAQAFVARIGSWTDPDGPAREGGAELRQYLAAGRDYGPRNAPFESVGELRQVLGGTHVSDGILDSLTVYTHTRLPDSTTVPPALDRALVWADAHRLGSRSWLSSSRSRSGASLGTDARSLIGQVVRVHACASLQEAVGCRLAIVRITGDPRNPFQIFVWDSVWQSS